MYADHLCIAMEYLSFEELHTANILPKIKLYFIRNQENS